MFKLFLFVLLLVCFAAAFSPQDGDGEWKVTKGERKHDGKAASTAEASSAKENELTKDPAGEFLVNIIDLATKKKTEEQFLDDLRAQLLRKPEESTETSGDAFQRQSKYKVAEAPALKSPREPPASTSGRAIYSIRNAN
eukprot:TRINITY_DN10293_c0_g1_i1.p1 TRINITY_DN10293_c0_g1~~TRINITY_DN10293_c0_g1_i1.p1  ORF type:complete len:139 (-),score=25.04 TRINITY_DN10293_c0_g1_i1:97-513(-)